MPSAVTAIALTAALALSLWSADAQAQRTHRVRAGQTLIQIARRHRVDPFDLATHNRLRPNATLRVGQQLEIPPAGITFVRPRQSLRAIAEAHGVDVTSLARRNRLRVDSRLRVGQRIELPGRDALAPVAPRDWGASPHPGVVRLRTRDGDARVRLRDEAGRVPRAGLDELERLMRGAIEDEADEGPAEDPPPEDAQLEGTDDDAQDAEAPGLEDVGQAPPASARARLTAWARRVFPRASGEGEVVADAAPEPEGPDPRLALLLAAVADHFGGRDVTIVSGLRRAGGYTRRASRHVSFQATDIRVQGVPARAIWDFCTSLRGTGCGLYPNSTFVHVDVREQAAQWVDWSGPGQRPRYGGMRGPWRTRNDRRTDRVTRHVTSPAVLPDEAIVADDGAPATP